MAKRRLRSSQASSEEEVEERINTTNPDPQDQGSESESAREEQAADENPQPVVSAPSKPNGMPPIKRSWTFQDEIAILKEMTEHQSKHGTIRLTAEGVTKVHECVRNSLNKHVSDAKLADKLRKMKKKFISANKKGDKVKFAQPHDEVVYELSKEIWGRGKDDEEDGNSVGRDGKGSKKRYFPYIIDAIGGNMVAVERLELVDEKKATVFENKLKKLKLAEFNLVREVYNFLFEEAGCSIN